MNAAYNQTSPSDASKVFGVTPQTVTLWCRNGIIRYQDVSAGSARPRYIIPDKEMDRVSGLIKKYGKRNWMLYNNIKEEVACAPEPIKTIPAPEEEYTAVWESEADKVARTILYIKDIKERLEDLEAERNQLIKELEEMRNEVLAYIE